MRSSFPVKSFALVGAATLALYFVTFFTIEGCRRAKGPWEVAFSTNPEPAIRITQRRSQIACAIHFYGEKIDMTNSVSQFVAFDRPKKSVPFGKVIYEDLMQLPGVVTFDMFGHEIELLPRVLIVNKREVPWATNLTLNLWPTNKLAQAPKPRPSWQR